MDIRRRKANQTIDESTASPGFLQSSLILVVALELQTSPPARGRKIPDGRRRADAIIPVPSCPPLLCDLPDDETPIHCVHCPSPTDETGEAGKRLHLFRVPALRRTIECSYFLVSFCPFCRLSFPSVGNLVECFKKNTHGQPRYRACTRPIRC